VRLAIVLVLAACASPTGTTQQALSDDVRHQRLGVIRDQAAQMGVYNAALLGGIATSETGLAHCNSEVGFGCPGPASPSCNGDPILAGGADGPCADMQGGLGMFQFDAGTYADTLVTYGDSVLTIEGNSAFAVSFVIAKVEQDIAGAGDWLSAADWINQVPLSATDPVMQQWASLLACRYNGCCTASATCTSRANGYRDNALAVFSELGADFWRTADRCGALPPGNVIEQRSTCYLAGGDPRYWRQDPGGQGGYEWTLATDAQAPANFAEWLIRGATGRYHVEVYVDGGQSRSAKYEVAHAGSFDDVVIDQSAAHGYVALGDFAFGGSDDHVLLGDDTGEASSTNTRLAFDAVRLTPLDGQMTGTTAGGGCSAGGAPGLGAALALVLTRRRRACAA
jgi:hypothetical protein